MDGRLPNLLVIGAMKSGTSSLHNYLNLHPDIFMSQPKEIHYYADENFHSKSKEWYMGLFKSDKKIVGTSPQSYTKCHNKYYKNIPERIHSDTPDVKMIYIVRDPIKRYASHVLESNYCDPIKDIKYNWGSGHFWKTSLYFMQLSAYLKYFRKEQILVVSLEDLNLNPLIEMNKVFEFLNLDKMDMVDEFHSIYNSAETKGIPRFIKGNLFYKIGERALPRVTKRIGKSVSKLFFERQLKKPILTEEEVEELKVKLSEDIVKFRALTGKKFDQWSI